MKTLTTLLASMVILMSCNFKADGQTSPVLIDTTATTDSSEQVAMEEIIPTYQEFDRSKIREKLQLKIDNHKPLVAHVLVPLCDNENPGIVPTTKSLGDGQSLRTNLYWATSNGIKRYFKEKPDWKLLKSTIYHPDSTILERVIFKKKFANGAEVILIADAYRGDRMAECLTDFFHSLSGELSDSLTLDNEIVHINSKADLIAFNGHNGLMDTYIEDIYNKDGIQKDAVVIACSSQYDFNTRLNLLQAYPLVMTTNLLYPGAFVMEAVVNNWATMETNENVRLSAGDAYHRVKQCGKNGARNLFSTGW